jgi:hypothetical protein
VTDDIFEEWGLTRDNLARYLDKILDRLFQMLEEVDRAIAANTAPVINAAAAAASEVEQAIAPAIGLGGTLVIASGLCEF